MKLKKAVFFVCPHRKKKINYFFYSDSSFKSKTHAPTLGN